LRLEADGLKCDDIAAIVVDNDVNNDVNSDNDDYGLAWKPTMLRKHLHFRGKLFGQLQTTLYQKTEKEE